jgi:hypothetical protein
MRKDGDKGPSRYIFSKLGGLGNLCRSANQKGMIPFSLLLKGLFVFVTNFLLQYYFDY